MYVAGLRVDDGARAPLGVSVGEVVGEINHATLSEEA